VLIKGAESDRSSLLVSTSTLEEVLDDHIKPLDIPAWYGSMIGHIENKFTIPLGIRAEIDADNGRISLLEPAVV
jgi:muramoyltetrapeptide carboxypeptidase